MPTLFLNSKVFTPNAIFERYAVVVSDNGKISYIGHMENLPKIEGQRIDLQGKILAPGFIDIHVHGGKGITFGDDNLLSGLTAYSKWAAEKGVCGFLLSIASPSASTLLSLISSYSAILGNKFEGAEPLGIHLEGPFLNPEKKGAFNPTWFHEPSIFEAQSYLDAANSWIRQITMAPEVRNAEAVARLFRNNGVVVALGHSNANYETALHALNGEFFHVTHAFNAQSGFNHRQPGVVGAILSSDHSTVELIADGVHVHPAAMKTLIRALGTDRVVLITDAMAAAGMDTGKYRLVGNEVLVKDNRATLEDGTLAGSIATMNQCVLNINQMVGYSLQEAVKMATQNPANAIGLNNRLGSIQVGKDASLIVIDENVNVYLTMVKGELVFNQL